MEIPEEEKQEAKRRFQLWIKPSTLAIAEQFYRPDNCSSKSEYIEKAVLFYSGYLSSNQSQDYLGKIKSSDGKRIQRELEKAMALLARLKDSL